MISRHAFMNTEIILTLSIILSPYTNDHMCPPKKLPPNLAFRSPKYSAKAKKTKKKKSTRVWC